MRAVLGPLKPSDRKTGIDYSGHHDAYVWKPTCFFT